MKNLGNQMSRQNFWIICLISSFMAFNFIAAKEEENIEEKNTENSENEDTFYESLKKLEIPDDYALKEVVIGDENAPVVLIVYSSFTCNHCRKFHLDIFPKFKEKYIDTGKVKVYLRNYLDDVAALEASILVRCFGEDNSDSVLKMYRKIFENQKQWMQSSEPHEFLKKIFIDDNNDMEKVDACLQNKKIPAGLMKEQQRAMQQLHIFSVPAFIRKDGKMHIGKITFEELKKFLTLEDNELASDPKSDSQDAADVKNELMQGKSKKKKKPKRKIKKPDSTVA